MKRTTAHAIVPVFCEEDTLLYSFRGISCYGIVGVIPPKTEVLGKMTQEFRQNSAYHVFAAASLQHLSSDA